MLIFGLTGIRIFTRIVECPKAILFPLILLLSVVGAFSINNSVSDVWWMLGFGVFGYLLKLYGYQVGPIVLGIILSRLMDDNWRRAIISERDSVPAFMLNLVSSPLSLTLLLVIIFVILSQTPLWKYMMRLIGRRDDAASGSSLSPKDK